MQTQMVRRGRRIEWWLLVALLWSVPVWAADLPTFLNSMRNTVEPIQRLATGAAYVMGIGLVFRALYQLKIYGDLRTMMSSNASLKEPLTYLFVGALFIYFPTGFQIAMQTTFGQPTILGYADLQASGDIQYDDALKIVVLIIQTIGLFSFIRGWILVTRNAKQGTQTNPGKAIAHIIGGLLAINIVATAQIVRHTFGM